MHLHHLSHIVITVLAALTVLGGCRRGDTADGDAQLLRQSLARIDSLIDDSARLTAKRAQTIAGLKAKAQARPSASTLQQVAGAYENFNTDSAIAYYDRAIAATSPRTGQWGVLTAHRAALTASQGMGAAAVMAFNQADTTVMTQSQLIEYYEAGNAMLHNIRYYVRTDSVAMIRFTQLMQANDSALMHAMRTEPQSARYRFCRGRQLLDAGQKAMAMTLIEGVFSSAPPGSDLFVESAMLLGTLEREQGNDVAYRYYMAQAATATLERGDYALHGLSRLGLSLYQDGDRNRGQRYMNMAMDYASRSDSRISLLLVGDCIPLVDPMLASQRRTLTALWVTLAIVLTLALAAAIVCIVLWRKHKRNTAADHSDSLSRQLTESEAFLARIVEVCLGYGEQLTAFAGYAQRKISAGKADELAREIKNGKFTADSSAEFFDIFDQVVMRLYPGFVQQVNTLLQPGQRIDWHEGQPLTTDLRIAAFMRLGIDDTPLIAQALGYSVNTVYAYRTRLRQRALNKDTFEAAVRSIPIA